jgi:hypothetical protein
MFAFHSPRDFCGPCNGYIEGGMDPSPVVVTFTAEIAAVAMNELLHRLTGLRGPNGHCAEHPRRFDWIKDAVPPSTVREAGVGQILRE